MTTAERVATASGFPEIVVLLGNGNGTFQPAQTYATQNFPEGIAAADFNGDGKLDLVVDNNVNLPILLGNGDGTFQTAISFGPTSGGDSVAVADFNQDGKADLVATTLISVAILTQTAPAATSLSATQLHFGRVRVRDDATQTITLTNTGVGTLVVSSVNFKSVRQLEFSENDTCVNVGLTPGQSCDITVCFHPNKPGHFQTKMIVHDNGSGAPHKVALFGVGTRN